MSGDKLTTLSIIGILFGVLFVFGPAVDGTINENQNDDIDNNPIIYSDLWSDTGGLIVLAGTFAILGIIFAVVTGFKDGY